MPLTTLTASPVTGTVRINSSVVPATHEPNTEVDNLNKEKTAHTV